MGIETFVGLIIFGASSYMSYKLNQKAQESGSPFNDRSKPPTYAERGSYAPHLTSRRRLGPHVCWIGDRVNQGGGVIRESALYVLCVGGDVHAITKIFIEGKPLISTPSSFFKSAHSSGARITGPQINGFPTTIQLYWGEATQPVNTYLGASSRVGISSRWPHFCYVILERVALSGGVWPQIEYEVEVRDGSPGLSDTSPYMSGTATTLDTKRTDNIQSVVNGSAGTAKVRVNGYRSSRYIVGSRFRMQGNATPDADYTVAAVSYNAATNRTTITTVEAIAGSNNAGTITPYIDDANDGINPAHILYKQLFKTWPQGVKLDTGVWSLQSLEDLGTLMASEGVPGAVLIANGELLQASVGNTLQDLGCFISWDVRIGKFVFYPIRYSSLRAVVNEDVELPSPPEIVTIHDVSDKDKTIFTFPDKNHRWREDTVGEDNDGRASHNFHPSSNKTPFYIVTDYRTAVVVAERRMMEDTGEAAVFEFQANREGRLLFSGEPISVYGVPQNLRLTEKTIEVNRGEVKLRATLDAYGNEVTTSTAVGNPEGIDPSDEEPDTVAGGAKLPATALSMQGSEGSGLATSEPPALIVTRIRGPNGTSSKATIYISPDDAIYTKVGTIDTYHTGGPLQSSLLNTDPDDDAVGPDIEVYGPDLTDLILDLSSDEDGRVAGKQLLIIDEEIMCLGSITVVDATHVTLNGILRAQFGTTKVTHAAGAIAYIVKAENLILVRDPLMISGSPIYWKVVPETDGIAVAIDDVPAASTTL